MAERQQPPVVSAAAAGDRLGTLRAMRDILARQLADPTTPARELAALTGRMQAVLAEIADLEPPATTKGTPLDELAAARAARGPAAARAPRAGGR